MSESNDLIVVEEKHVLAAFTSKEGLGPLVQQAKQLIEGFEHNIETATGRAKTASLAAKVSKFKVRLDAMGKDLVADWKSKSRVVDSSRKSMRDALDDLRVEARRPLTEWEDAEVQRIKAEAAKQQQIQIDNEHELALLHNKDFDRERALSAEKLKSEQEAEAAKIEDERIAREQEIAEQARAQSEAEYKRRIEQAEQDKTDSETRRIAAEAYSKAQEAEYERQRIRVAEQAEQDKSEALEAAAKRELARQAQEAESARVVQEKLEANKRHVGKIRNEAKQSLMQFVDEATAKKIVLAISANEVDNVSIKY